MGAQQSLLTPDGAQALAHYLRENPEEAYRAPEDLAGDFGLPREFVSEVLAAVRSTPSTSTGEGQVPFATFRAMGRAGLEVVRVITDNPLLCVGVSTLIVVLVLSIVTPGFEVRGSQPRGASLEITTAGFAVIGPCIALHLLCYYRHAMSRLALQGALVTWLIAAPTAMIHEWLKPSSNVGNLEIPVLMALALVMLLVCFTVGGLGVIAAVIGGYVRVRRSDRAEARMTRQQLLERLFEIQSRLKGHAAESGSPSRLEIMASALRSHPFTYGAVLGVSTHLVQVLSLNYLVQQLRTSPELTPLVVALSLAVTLLQLLAMIAVGFCAGGVVKAILAVMWLMAWMFVTELIPFPRDPEMRADFTDVGFYLSQFGMAAFVGLFAGLGAIVQERASKQVRLRANDPAALLAELVRIQWRLGPSIAHVCVMVVDAAKSSMMKQDADHHAVEYSFREYLLLIEKISERHSGRVHNTMGDGAIATFDRSSDALGAAKEILSAIDAFNRDVNRLDQPFRLRIGLHKGLVTGDIDKVEFSQVIDIAAHVQGAAPVGGIALTEDVAQDLPGEPLTQLEQPVDGCKVFLSANSPSG